ncbi:MAG: DUF4299 family protein [Bacilli bacterium]
MYSFSIKKSMELSLYEVDYFMDGKLYCDSFDLSLNSMQKKKVMLEHKESYYIGVEGKCGRGFEIYVLENSFEIVVNSPATLQDWESTVTFMSKLAVRENSLIRDIEGNSYTFESILEFDYYLDIERGLSALYEMLCVNKKQEIIHILGMRYSQIIDAKIMQSFFDSDDLLISFSDFIRENQWLEYETTSQKILEHKDTNDIVSIYYIVVNEPTIIPIKPMVEIAYDMQDIKVENVDKFIVLFLDESLNVIGEFNHYYLEELLPKNKYKIIDARNIAIDGLTVEEMKDLVSKSLVKDGE